MKILIIKKNLKMQKHTPYDGGTSTDLHGVLGAPVGCVRVLDLLDDLLDILPLSPQGSRRVTNGQTDSRWRGRNKTGHLIGHVLVEVEVNDHVRVAGLPRRVRKASFPDRALS